MKNHKYFGELLISRGELLFWIGIAISVVILLLGAGVADGFGAVAFGYFVGVAIATFFVMLLLSIGMEAAGHIIILLDDQAKSNNKIASRLAQLSPADPITQAANEKVKDVIQMQNEADDKKDIDSFIEELQKTMNENGTDNITYTVEKDTSNGNQIVINVDGPKLAAKINAAAENYKDSWAEYVSVQKDLVKYASRQLKSRDLDGWAVLLRVVDSSINRKLLSIYNNTVIYDFLGEFFIA